MTDGNQSAERVDPARLAPHREVPCDDEFRAWLTASLKLAQMRPARLSALVGGGVNSVGRYLGAPDASITLARAFALEAALRSELAALSRVPPEMIGGQDA